MCDLSHLERWTDNRQIVTWIREAVDLCRPRALHLCDGSVKEYQQLTEQLVHSGLFTPLKRPNSFWCHSTPSDVARVEESTFICSHSLEDAGPTNHWRDPKEMKQLLVKLFTGCMEGRTLYVIPFLLGPIGSALSRVGIQITDSPYVVCNMYIMTQMGLVALKALKNGSFVPCMHSVGVPLQPGQKDEPWPCRSDQKYIVHFPEERSIWSFGSGYGGNALLGKKSFALRIASVMGRQEGWLAEHMLIMGITNPEGKKKYIAAAFPSSCGKTNLAMLLPSLPGWRVECVGDDIAWMRFDEEGCLRAVNPEAGFFGVAPGTSYASNPHAMRSIEKNTIFTNVALTEDRDVWWEGMTPSPPPHLTDWEGKPWDPALGRPAAHPNARFTAPASQCPVSDPARQDPRGVPISAIIFGGRRASTVPLVYEARNWQHGVFIGASVSSEMTAAAKGVVGKVRHDPFAMLPFCGYHMGDYFAHWLAEGKKGKGGVLPKMFHVNWFRKHNGRLLWPGYGENSRILRWIFERVDGTIPAQESPIGYVPYVKDLDLSGLAVTPQDIEELFRIDIQEWQISALELEEYFSLFSPKLPQGMYDELSILKKSLGI